MDKRILFLGYEGGQTPVPDWLRQFGEVTTISGRVDTLAEYDSIVVYGYRHILRRELLAEAKTPPINLHISYLPYNRGAHPNFWCWIENTPAGVTIHEVDPGLDTGPIVTQRELGVVDDEATFEETYWELRELVESVFFEEYNRILQREYAPVPQNGVGSFHRASDLPKWVSWKMKIKSARERFLSDHER